ncbi:MAG: DNA repair protein RecO [Dehalobacter sp. 4CP]|uniref:DNA repair protein RecO n=1 Tax=Dehalobacter sp. CP TaxID=2594474 RepID=UPI0013C614BD|nr:DNA repair protein RecO [Dehalobacter sp.]NBJ16850.1 DNA repair protein RecO [Dehalobacter sp. 4CP]
MAVYQADAIVIRSREYGESDRLITLFSREKGKLEAVAKGVRKPKSTQRGGTQLFTYADFLLYRGKTLDTVNQAQPRENFIHLWDDFDRTITASAMVELLDISTVREQPDPELFTLTLSFLFLLKHLDPYMAQAAYALRLMHLQGYLPSMEGCTECGGDLSGEQVYLSAEAGGFLCAACKNNRIVRALNPGSLALMRQLYQADLVKIDRLRWNKKMRQEILESLCHYCEQKFERKLLAWRQGSEFWNK